MLLRKVSLRGIFSGRILCTHRRDMRCFWAVLPAENTGTPSAVPNRRGRFLLCVKIWRWTGRCRPEIPGSAVRSAPDSPVRSGRFAETPPETGSGGCADAAPPSRRPTSVLWRMYGCCAVPFSRYPSHSVNKQFRTGKVTVLKKRLQNSYNII